MNTRLRKLFASRCSIETMSIESLYDRQSSFWTKQAPVTQGSEIARAFCSWQSSLKEEALLKEDLQNIRKHAEDDVEKLTQVLQLENRVYARHLIESRIIQLKKKIQLIHS